MSDIEPRFSPFPLEMDVDKFRLRISKWANQNKVSGDPDGMHASFLYTIGHNINMENGSWMMSWFQISQGIVKHRKKIGKTTNAPSRATIARYTNWARENGLIETERTPFRYDSGKILPGANRIWVNVNRIAVYGEVQEWDFLNAENPDPQFEETDLPIPDAVPALTLVGKDEASMSHRRGIDETSHEASMRHNTVLDTGRTVRDTGFETVLDTVRRERREVPPGKSKKDKITANASATKVVQNWIAWNKVVLNGPLASDIGTSVGPAKLKAVLDGYRKEFLDDTWTRHESLIAYLDGEMGLRRRLDKDLGLNLAYLAELRDIEEKEKKLAEHWDDIYPTRRDEWKRDVDNFRRLHPMEVAG